MSHRRRFETQSSTSLLWRTEVAHRVQAFFVFAHVSSPVELQFLAQLKHVDAHRGKVSYGRTIHLVLDVVLLLDRVLESLMHAKYETVVYYNII